MINPMVSLVVIALFASATKNTLFGFLTEAEDSMRPAYAICASIIFAAQVVGYLVKGDR